MLKNYSFQIILSVCGFIFAAYCNASPILKLNDNGILTGAANVLVDGHLYDVEFKDGDCGTIQHLCDLPSNFIFNSNASAQAASQALLDQVFIGIYDDNIHLTSGCDYISPHHADTGTCTILTPFYSEKIRADVVISSSAAINQQINSVSTWRILGNDSTKTMWVYATYAVWSSSAEVPEPSSSLLFATGLTLLVLRRWRKRA